MVEIFYGVAGAMVIMILLFTIAEIIWFMKGDG